MRSLALLLPILLAGCAPPARNLRWEFEFADATLGARAQVVVGRILANGCGSGSVVYEDEAGRGEMPSMPPSLLPGTYGFEGVARDASCVEFARACVELDVPRPEGELVLVRLLGVAESTACPTSMCTSGRCAPIDGGGPDAGLDAPPRMDTPGIDGGGDAGSPDAPIGVDVPSIDAPMDAGVPRLVAHYAVGQQFVCAITTDGALHCWGDNISGQLGQGVLGLGTELSRPTRVGTETTWTRIGAGGAHVCATLGTDLYCWGENEDGQLGTMDVADRSTPTRVPATAGAFAAIAGAQAGDQTFILRSAGVLAGLGQNNYGQLGVGDILDRAVFTTWAGTYRSVGPGHHFTCAVGTDGVLSCTGRNQAGQQGSGVLGGLDALSPVAVGTGTNWTEVSGGDMHACALRGLGELWCWGQGADGRLGTGGFAIETAPVRIGTGTDWTAVSAGGQHTCGLRGSGELWCWGAATYGQLGFASAADVTTPTRVGTASDWTSVRTGADMTCGLRGPDLYCWGSNAFGELGRGDVTPSPVPTRVLIY